MTLLETSFSEIKHEVCRITTSRASEHFLSDTLTGRKIVNGTSMFMDPGSFHFRVPFFGTEIDSSVSSILSRENSSRFIVSINTKVTVCLT